MSAPVPDAAPAPAASTVSNSAVSIRTRVTHMRLLRFASFFQLVAMALSGSFEAVWIRTVGLDEAFIGRYLFLFSVCSLVSSLLWGWLADKWGRAARLASIGCFLYGVAMVILPFAHTAGVFLIFAVLKGCLFPMAFTMMPILVASVAAAGSEGKNHSSYRIYGSYGFLTANVLLPLACKGFQLQVGSFLCTELQLYFFLGGAAMVVASVPLFFYRVSGVRRAQRGAIWYLLKKPELSGYYLALFFYSFATPALFPLYSTYAKSLGGDMQFIGLLNSCMGIVGLTTLPVMGWLIDRTQPRYILWLAFLGQPLRAAAISLIQSDHRMLMLPQIFHILTWAGPEIATVYYLTRLVGDENRGTALGFAYSVSVLGAMVGAPISGDIAVHAGYPAMYRMAAGVSGLGLVVFTVCLWMRRRAAAEDGKKAAMLNAD